MGAGAATVRSVEVVRQEDDGGLTGIVGHARQGDRLAFAELHRRFARMVHGILLARVPSGVADDLVQDVFVSALEGLDQLRDDAAFGGWLVQIARHRAADWLRARKLEVELPAELADDVHAGACGAHAEALQVLAVLRGLPEAYRETLAMRLVEGMTGPEIAEKTGLAPGSVRVNLHRGMQLLRARLAGTPTVEDDHE